MKKALVTGSSRGIGAAAARALAEDGWRVTINYLNSRERGEALAAELGTEAIRCDVSDSAQVREIAEKKMPDLNAASIETAMSMVKGTARSMGVTVAED